MNIVEMFVIMGVTKMHFNIIMKSIIIYNDIVYNEDIPSYIKTVQQSNIY